MASYRGFWKLIQHGVLSEKQLVVISSPLKCQLVISANHYFCYHLYSGKEKVHQPSPELLERLKGVYVSSHTDVVTVSINMAS